jgi:uncharacterized membrane protein YqgA involved in biofilm formation
MTSGGGSQEPRQTAPECVFSILIFGLGLVLLDLEEVPVSDMLPALHFAAALARGCW